MANKDQEVKEKNLKIYTFFGFATILGLTLILRLFYLQIFKHQHYVKKAQYSTSRIEIQTAPRGNIYDRKGNLIATNKQSIAAIVYPDKVKTIEEKKAIYKILSKILPENKEKLRKRLMKIPSNAVLPVVLESDITVEQATLIVENKHKLTGIEIQDTPIRYYPTMEGAAHVIGYIGQISEREMEERPDRRLGDIVGKDGIEKVYDDILRGKDGQKIIAVDRFGTPVDSEEGVTLINIDPIPGKELQLTIDLDLQLATEKALKEAMVLSAAIAINPNNGEVLALASYPTYDPNVFTKPIPSKVWNDLIANKVFLNRSILSFVPGSIWKPVTLIAGLDAMVVKPGDSLHVSGATYLGSTRFGDWTGEVGIFTLEKCLAWSRDTAFYQIAKKLTATQIYNWAKTLGAGAKTGIELLGEHVGILPNEKWKEENLKEKWYPGNTLHYSIGQSFLLITPAQAVRMYSGIAHGSEVPKLKLIKKIDGVKTPIKPKDKFTLKPEYLKVVRDGLEQCVASGTGGATRLETINIAGKTGSAEVPGSSKTHAWFASYAPAKKPTIAIVVFAEKAGHGGSIAAPIAKKIYTRYFGLDVTPIIPAEANPQQNTTTNTTTITTTNTTNSTSKKKRKWRIFGRRN